MVAVFMHEAKMYSHNIASYVFGAFLLMFTGIGVMIYNLNASVANFEYVLNFISLIYVVLVPILTMRIIAEERKQKTDQLLYALPISSTDVVIGKFAALMCVFLAPMLIICIYPLIFSRFGDVYLPTSYGSILAFIMLGMTLIAIGMYISSLTESQGLAAGLCVAVMLFIYYMDTIAQIIAKEGVIVNFVSNISLFSRFRTFVNGIFDLSALVYYISVTIFFLFLCVQSLEKRRYD